MERPDKKIPPQVGDAVVRILEEIMGCEMHIILCTFPCGAHAQKQFITDLEPDIMEAVVVEIGREFEEGLAGKRDTLGWKAP